MGTRADFYIGRGKDAEWLGSIAFDGYPENILDGTHMGSASDPDDFRRLVTEEQAIKDHWTAPADGWPWPWEDSGTTDCAYAFDEGRVWCCWFGRKWLTMGEALDPERSDENDGKGKSCVFPDMSARKNVTFGKRSGLLIIGVP